jgi:hypothetical protein
MPSLLPWILLWGGLLLADWLSPGVACVTPVLCLCRSCRGQATFGEMAVGRVLSFSPGSSSPRWSRQPAAGAAGPLARAGPLDLARGDSWDASRQTALPLAYTGVIPTTLAPETGEVSWASMGLRQVLCLAEVCTLPSKSQDSSSGREFVDLNVKSHGVSPAVSGHAGSKSDPAGGCYVAARWCLAPWDLLPRSLSQGATCPCTAASRPIGPGPTILCGNHGGCPILTRSWRMTEGPVASSSWVKCATDPPSLF